MSAVLQHSRRRAAAGGRSFPWYLRAKWATARGLFYAYVFLSMASGGVFGFLTGPLMTWCFYGDWRFWRHWHSAWRLCPHAYKMLFLVLQGRNGGFMLDVPLTAEPMSSADRNRVRLTASWEFGDSCGPCSRCCTKMGCPVLNETTGMCRGYDSFFWRYFNCGRFPSGQRELEYYQCPKWEMTEAPDALPQPDLSAEPEEAVA